MSGASRKKEPITGLMRVPHQESSPLQPAPGLHEHAIDFGLAIGVFGMMIQTIEEVVLADLPMLDDGASAIAVITVQMGEPAASSTSNASRSSGLGIRAAIDVY